MAGVKRLRDYIFHLHGNGPWYDSLCAGLKPPRRYSGFISMVS
jgi:hypothetical protein